MPNQSFTFNTFANGLSNDPTKWKTHGYYSAGLDLIGIKDIGANPNGARPNTLQLAQELTPDTISGSTLVGLVDWIRKFNGNYYAFISNTSSGGEGLLMSAQIGGAWVSAKYTSAAAGGGGLEFFGPNALYFGQQTVLGRLSSDGTYLLSAGTFSTGTISTPRPMKVFAGVLNIGNNRYVSTVDSAGTFTAAALTLPLGYTIRSMEVLGNYLVISADNGLYARIFLWTGGTATFQEAYDLPEIVAPTLVSREGRVFAIGVAIYILNEVSFQTLYPFNYYGRANGAYPSPGSISNWKNRVLYGLNDLSNLTNLSADQTGGVYLLGQYDTTYPIINSLHLLLPNQITSAGNYQYAPNQITVGGIFTDHGANVKVAYSDGAASALSAKYGIASMQQIFSPIESNYAYYLTLPLTMDTDNKKLFQSIRLNFTGKTTNTDIGIAVSYRLDVDFTDNITAENWISLGTKYTVDSQIPLPIRQIGRNIVFKLQPIAHDATQNVGPQLLSYTIRYSVLDEYR